MNKNWRIDHPKVMDEKRKLMDAIFDKVIDLLSGLPAILIQSTGRNRCHHEGPRAAEMGGSQLLLVEDLRSIQSSAR